MPARPIIDRLLELLTPQPRPVPIPVRTGGNGPRR